MNKKEAKEEIKILIEKYEKIKNSGKLKGYTEEDTKNSFIIPLFETLGWDFSNKNEVSSEETISGDRVDYGFYINDRIQFYLETKKLSVDLHKKEFANQAIRYSWNKGATWAILTDFESIIIFNAQDIKRKLADKLYTEIPYNQYLERFDQLWLLSKESFKSNLLDKDAEIHGKKFIKVPVTSLLYEDLEKCRDMLTKDLGKMNEKISTDLLDEGIQKLLDRLIFIRVAEDRGIEDKILIPLAREARSGNKKIYESMVEKFREFDNLYNSNLFLPHPFEQWEEYSGVTERVINILYGKEGYYEYDFKAMPADVLGAVYENYLGHRLSQSKKGVTVAKDAKKRKEHGIYYTPSFIVDYIVKNALKPVLDKCKSVSDLNKIKVLDPACGSGSFLIKAMDLIAEKHKEFGARGDEDLVKLRILEENIYGVDLDPQAVEITRLNLLINALVKKEKLPFLNHIKNGNSLISGIDEELEKYFGKNFRDKKPFNWGEEFPQVFKQGGFDVIIGNPPYIDIRKINDDEKKYLFEKFNCTENRANTFSIFIEKSLFLLKEAGYLSFIIPNTILTHSSYKKLRKEILNQSLIVSIFDPGKNVFEEATVETVVLVLNKNKNLEKRENNNIKIIKKDLEQQEYYLKQKLFSTLDGQKFLLYNPQNSKVISKIKKYSIDLGEIYHGYNGINPGNQKSSLVIDKKIDERYKKVIDGKNIKRFSIKWGGNYILYDKKILERARNENIFLAKPKIMLQKIGMNLVGGLDTEKLYALINTTILLKKSDNYDEKFILALINSKLLNYFYKKEFLGVQIKTEFLEKIPIHKIDFSDKKEKEKHDSLVKWADKMLELNKELQKTTENSEKWNSIKSEIEKIDKKIDEEVYKLYGLTPEEIKIVENYEF